MDATIMSAGDIDRIMARLQTIGDGVAALRADSDTHRAQLAELFTRLDSVKSSGCSIHPDVCRRVSNLEDRPAKTIGLIATISAIASATGAGIMWVVSCVHKGNQ